MRCPRCDEDNAPSARFCRACGGVLGVLCATCRHANPAGSRFCNDCGQPLPVSRFGSPEHYTPGHLAQRILTSRSALEGERKGATVLFADLRGSLELLAGRDPEEARDLLDPILEGLMEAVHRFEGTVNQVMGDGIMALFGAPLAHEDHAVRACYAALHMQEAIRARMAQSPGRDVQIRIGINSGEVVVRSIDTDLHVDYSAIGETTHLAARMEQLARPGTILITAETARLVEGYVEVRPLGSVPVKGLSAPVETYEVVGAGRARSRLDVSAARGLTRFVGREAEIAQLEWALHRATEGRGQVVGIVGEPGVGKSRLLREFLRDPRMAGWRTLEATGVAYGRSSAYLPVIGLLRAHFGLGEDDEAPIVRDKVRAAVHPEDGVRVLAPVLALLDASVEDEEWVALESPQRRYRTLDALRRLFVRETLRQPLCVAVEELHWIDAETQAVLDTLVESLPTSRLLLFVTYRPEYRHEWANKTYYRQLSVDPLPADQADELLRDLVGSGPDTQAVRAMLVKRAEGNPLFLEESVKNLVETGVLRGVRGAYRIAGPLDEERVPDTVRSVLAARIDRLAPGDKHVLQAAAVIGREVALPVLEAVADVPEGELSTSLSRLQAAEFLYQTSVYPDVEYTFKHSLMLEVAYAGLLHERRRELDARIVAALERLEAEGSRVSVDRIAHHAVRGELWEKAFHFCREAGSAAFGRSAHRAAAGHFEHALAALARLEQTRERVEQAIDIRLDLRYSLSPLGEYRKMLHLLSEARRLADGLGDRRRLGLVLAFLANFSTLRGDFDGAIEYGGRALSIGEELEDIQVMVLASALRSLGFWASGDYRPAIGHAERAVRLLPGDLVFERLGMAHLPSVYARTVMTWSLAELGQFADARPIGEEAIRIARAARHPHSLVFGLLGLGTLHLRCGDFALAIDALEEGRAVCDSVDLPAVFLELAFPLASAYAATGRADEAIALLEHAISRAIALQHGYGHWLRTGGLAQAYLAAGHPEEALRLARQFLDVTRVVKARGSGAWALRMCGEAAALHKPARTEEAEAAYREALARAEALGMRPLEGQCHLGLALLHGGPEAIAELDEADRIFRELGMPWWSERVARQRGHL